MDLNSIDITAKSNEGIVVDIYHPASRQPLIDDKSGEKVSITVLGRFSDAYIKTQKKFQNRKLSQKGRVKLTADELEGEAIETLCKCVVAWSHVSDDGVELECNYANVRALLEKYLWLREQLEEAVTDESNFTNQP